MIKFIKENWFKITLLILASVFIFFYLQLARFEYERRIFNDALKDCGDIERLSKGAGAGQVECLGYYQTIYSIDTLERLNTTYKIKQVFKESLKSGRKNEKIDTSALEPAKD